MDWVTNQDLCFLNLHKPTRTGPDENTSVIDLTILSPAIYNKISYYVHPDQYDTDNHPIFIFNTLFATRTAPVHRPHWKLASVVNSLPALQTVSYQFFEDMYTQAIVTSNSKAPVKKRPHCFWLDATRSSYLPWKENTSDVPVLCSREQRLLYKSYMQLLRRIKYKAHNFWDSLCFARCGSGLIFGTLKRLTSCDSPVGDNALKNLGPLTTIQA